MLRYFAYCFSHNLSYSANTPCCIHIVLRGVNCFAWFLISNLFISVWFYSSWSSSWFCIIQQHICSFSGFVS
jgi:hypothetical protein